MVAGDYECIRTRVCRLFWWPPITGTFHTAVHLLFNLRLNPREEHSKSWHSKLFGGISFSPLTTETAVEAPLRSQQYCPDGCLRFDPYANSFCDGFAQKRCEPDLDRKTLCVCDGTAGARRFCAGTSNTGMFRTGELNDKQ